MGSHDIWSRILVLPYKFLQLFFLTLQLNKNNYQFRSLVRKDLLAQTINYVANCLNLNSDNLFSTLMLENVVCFKFLKQNTFLRIKMPYITKFAVIQFQTNLLVQKINTFQYVLQAKIT